jgi:hypothetical protein
MRFRLSNFETTRLIKRIQVGHKARVFEAALGFRQEHYDVLARLIRVTLGCAPALRGVQDEHGTKWTT